jgi:hypothetical protein
MEPEEPYIYGGPERFSLIDIRLPQKGPSAVEWFRFLMSACCAIAVWWGTYYLSVRFIVFVFVDLWSKH